jgi:hypothetical protein
MVQERLWAWNYVNDKWPSNMLFYRDGVSESQFKECQDKEIPMIKEAHFKLCKKDLNLTFVICGKRHHTRFYATAEKDTYRENPLNVGGSKRQNEVNGNLKPGLLVTSIVTKPTPFNFFLQSHRAIKGTARSAHYHVLEDGMKFGAHNLPRITMMLCYAFSRATTGVSYVAPAYIADRLCERGRIYLREWNLSYDMQPKMEVTPNDGETRVTKERIEDLKYDFAQTVADDGDVWGNNYGDGTTWENPWHPDLSERNGMFWM